MVETTKVVTGIGFGTITSIVIIGFATGGTSLVVIGIAAPIVGKVVGERLGWGAGKIYDIFDENKSKE
ncbi:hypothetical protein MXM33_05755 [Acinetobacter vivianii]|uniref:hypothetical protein n=1 Tax=Acinetobacter vivianii TaxID=1776742 RepID=UPI002DB72B23|nr:hypothetical protein [Acinetobacter vivianii]MEB6666531.1 hypothetical protein [Acinetobacter vivianii]